MIAILATLDTKAGEAQALAAHVAALGHEPHVIDVGLEPEHAGADTPARVVAAAVGGAGEAVTSADGGVAGLRTGGDRAAAMATMGRGAAAVLAELAPDGVLTVGGNQGTAIAALAVRALPVGVPKVIVSTVASGDVRPYVGDLDVTMMFSVGDLLGGPNPVTAPLLAQAAAAVCGMAAVRGERPDAAVGLTAFGNTHRACLRVLQRLREHGHAVVPFHASGACGSAMERLIDAGRIAAVADLTTHELLGELYPEDAYAPVRPGRLTAAGRAGIPQVVVPGGLEYFCFGPPESIPVRLRERPTHHHNPYNTNVRTSAEELARVGGLMAERLNAARGPAAVLVPARGWSEVGAPGGALHDPAANQALVDALEGGLRPRVELRVLDHAINDEPFADAVAGALLARLGDRVATPA
jgi:uncharacterized protein (UPF0261 family)